MILIPLLAAASAIATAAPAPAPSCKTADARIESLIATYARKLSGTEYCQGRLYHTLDDLDGDGRADFVLVFSIEGPRGANNFVQFLAVFPSHAAWKPIVMKVGERGERSIDDIDVEAGRTLLLVTSEYEEDDPMCCPSGDGELRFRLVNGRLTPVPNPDPDSQTPAGATKASVRLRR